MYASPVVLKCPMANIRSQIVPDRKVTEPSKEAKDVALGENLWRLSEQLLTEKLGTLPYVQST